MRALDFSITFTPEIQAWQTGTPSQQLLFAKLQGALNIALGNWSDRLKDDITVNLEVAGDTMLSPTSLAAALPGSGLIKYSEFKEALRRDITSENDRIAVEHLPKSIHLEFYWSDESGKLIRDSETDSNPSNNELVTVSYAVMKAIGLLEPDLEPDAQLFINTAVPAELALLSVDFDRSDGIDANKFSAVGIIEHEIGHALGFTAGNLLAENDDPLISPLDLFRGNENEPGSPTVASIPNISFGGTHYFSIDGGVTRMAEFHDGSRSTRSHWEAGGTQINGLVVDTISYGIMTRAIDFGVNPRISRNDLLAMDVMGYDLRSSIKPGQIKLEVKSNGDILTGDLTAKSVAPNESVSIIPNYRLQHSSDLKSWADFGDLKPGGLVQSFESNFEVSMNSPGFQFYRIVGTFNLPGAALSNFDLEGAILAGANLENATLIGCDLRESNLDRSNLKGADLTRAVLHFASFKSADLSNCNLTSASLFGANLEGAIVDGVIFENTVMPDGSIRNRADSPTP